MFFTIILSVFLLCGLGVGYFLISPSFGQNPSGERLEKIRKSPNYRNGMFYNQEPTPVMADGKNRLQALWEFVFTDRKDPRPEIAIPIVQFDYRLLPDTGNLMVWFGHSSYLLQVGGKRILVDPVFHAAAPVSFLNRPFAGTDIFNTNNIPDIDLLLITHNHWDHLDYRTITELREKVDKVVCPLGVGAHFERWGYCAEQLVESDCAEHIPYDSLVIHSLPARHFSGRGLVSNKTLWSSFLIESPSLTLYLGSDGGYGSHFKRIGCRAILENGQYSKDWRFIHIMPEQLAQVVSDLNARHVVTVHHSKDIRGTSL